MKNQEDQHAAAARNLFRHKLVRLPDLILMISLSADGHHTTHTRLVKVTGATRPNVSAAKQRLLDLGMIEEFMGASPADDDRVVKIYLTDKGKQRADELWCSMKAFVATQDYVKYSKRSQ